MIDLDTTPAFKPLPICTGPILWDPKTAELARGERRIALPSRTATLFDELYRRWLYDGGRTYVPRDEIATMLGVPSTSIAGIVCTANEHIGKVKLRVQGRLGPPGGYRLIDLVPQP